MRLQALLLNAFLAFHREEPTACAVCSRVTSPAGIREQGALAG